MLEGKLTRSTSEDSAPLHLELEGYILFTGQPLNVCIAGNWIPGHVEFGSVRAENGAWFDCWFLDTNVETDPSILLRPGVLARLDERW